MFGAHDWIRTNDYTDLQSVPLNHFGTCALIGSPGRIRTFINRFKVYCPTIRRQEKCYLNILSKSDFVT